MKIRAGQIVGGTKLGFEILGWITLKLSGAIYRTNMYSAMVSDNTSEGVLAISGNSFKYQMRLEAKPLRHSMKLSKTETRFA
jgi:hypothetical protein